MNIYTLGFSQRLLLKLEVALNGQGGLSPALTFSPFKGKCGALYCAFLCRPCMGAMVIFSLLRQF